MIKTMIKNYRLESKMTQQNVADILDVSRQAITRWENGDVEPSTENLIALSKLFNCTVDTLVNGHNNEVNEKTIKSYWSIEKENIFIISISLLVLIIYFIQMSIWSYSMTLFLAIELPIFFISLTITAVLNPETKTKAGFLSLIKTPLVIIIIHIFIGLTEL